MRFGVYCLFDRIAEEAAPVFCSKNDATAVRAARMALKDQREDDHVLYRVGEFDTDKVLLFLPEEGRSVRVEIPKEGA